MCDYKKYDIWKLSHFLTLEIYKITENYPKKKFSDLHLKLEELQAR